MEKSPPPQISQSPEPLPNKKGLWKGLWGTEYDHTRKEDMFLVTFQHLHNEGQLGRVIVDIGSGKYPVTRHLPPEAQVKVIAVDIASDEKQQYPNQLKIRFDIENLFRDQEATRAAVSKVGEFLHLDAGQDGALCTPDMQKQIDTIVCSDVLNYVDYQKVITSLKTYMKPGARLILAEMPGRGYKQLHSGAGLDSAYTLESFLERSGFEIEIRRENWPSLLVAKLV